MRLASIVLVVLVTQSVLFLYYVQSQGRSPGCRPETSSRTPQRQEQTPKSQITHVSWGECGGHPPRGVRQPDCRQVWESVPDPQLIVEFGGNLGEDLSKFLSLYPNARVHSFEPVQKFYHRLSEKFSDNKQVVLHNVGVSDKDLNVTFRTDGDQAATSQFGHVGNDNAPKVEEVKLVDVQAALDRIVKQENADIDVLSINCEGCEYAALEKIVAQGWHRRLRWLQVSFHDSSELKDRLKRRCRLMDRLNEVMRPAFVSDFGWQGWSAAPRLYAVDKRWMQNMPPKLVARSNGIGQAQSDLYCAKEDAVPAGAGGLLPDADPPFSHMTYPQSRQHEKALQVLDGSALDELRWHRGDAGGLLVMEVGAGLGTGPLMKALLQRLPAGSEVHSFEPIHQFLPNGQTTDDASAWSRKTWPMGLSDLDRRVSFQVWDSQSVPSSKGEPTSWAGRSQEVALRDVDDVLVEIIKESRFRGLDVLYLNCEGCEYEVLQRLKSAGKLTSIGLIAVSWHAMSSLWNFRCELDTALRKSHHLLQAALSYEVWVNSPIADKR